MKNKLALAGFSILFSLTAQAADVRIATSASTFPYSFGKQDGCTAKEGVCGFEVDLFGAICKEMSLNCRWIITDWNVIFKDLITPQRKGDFAYDAVVDSAEASAERRPQMLFSARYFTAFHLFVGKAELKVDVDASGFPLPQPRKPLKIGTWDGFLMTELQGVYRNIPKNVIQLVAVKDPAESLKKGEIDLAFLYTGTEIRLIKDKKYALKSPSIGVTSEDPFAGVGAAVRISPEGRRLEEAFSQGLVKLRRKGTFQAISNKWFGRDVWDCTLGPQLEKDPGCTRLVPAPQK